MLLYLVQHAESKKEEEDPARGLSEKGLQDIQRIASYSSKLDIKVKQIFHSTKLRAKQTAEVLSEILKPSKAISEVEGLAPLDDPHIWAERQKKLKENIILVGHLPHLEKLASLLLSKDANINIIEFRMAGIVCLKRSDSGEFSLQWMITPQIVE